MRSNKNPLGAICNRIPSNSARISEKTKKGFQCKLPETLNFVGEPCRNRTDNLMIKSHAWLQVMSNTCNAIGCGLGVAGLLFLSACAPIQQTIRQTNMDIRQEGFKEIVPYGYEARQYREFAQAGFLTQNLFGLLLTSIPFTRQSDFTKGYVAMAFIETVTYPLIWHDDGDLYNSNKFGGNATNEYIGYMAIATHNMLRIKWNKD